MSEQTSTRQTRVLLSFSSAYTDLARRIASDLRAASIDVRYDKWDGGGGVPAMRSPASEDLNDVEFVLPLLTPSNSAPTWIGDEWKQTIHDPARALGLGVLPVRGEGDLHAIPDFLNKRSFADLRERDYRAELRRLVRTIRKRSGDARIKIPDSGEDTARSPLTLPAISIVIEVGAALAPALECEGGSGRFVNELLPMMRDGLFYELGVQFPEPELRIVSDLPAENARIVFNDIPEAVLEAHPESIMINESVDTIAPLGISATPAENPANGAPSAWIPARETGEAKRRGFTTWDVPEYLILALSALLRRKAADFIGINETRAMIEQIEPVFPQLVAETVPKTVSLFVLTDVLRRLVAELVSIRNLRRILLALADWGRIEQDPVMLTEYVRAALRRQLTHQLTRGTNQLIVFLLHPEIETAIRDAMRYTATACYVDLDPARLRRIVGSIREPLDALPGGVQTPQILTPMEIRSTVRRLVATSMPRLHVVSYQELKPDTDIQPIGRISLEGFSPRRGASVGGVPLWT